MAVYDKGEYEFVLTESLKRPWVPVIEIEGDCTTSCIDSLTYLEPPRDTETREIRGHTKEEMERAHHQGVMWGNEITGTLPFESWYTSTFPIATATPDHWAESVKMADEMNGYGRITYDNGEYWLDVFPLEHELGPFSLPELHEKLISLRESEGTNENR